MGRAKARPASPYEKLCALSDNLIAEILDGRLHTQPRPSGRYGLAEPAINVRIGVRLLGAAPGDMPSGDVELDRASGETLARVP